MNVRADRSGIILVSVLAVFTVLTVFALSLGKITSANALFLESRIAQARARAASISGINYAVNLMTRFPSTVDSPWQCGLELNGPAQAEEYFKDVKADQHTTFSVTVTDESRRLNLNGMNAATYTLLAQLIQQYGFSSDVADGIAAAVVDWVDAGSEVYTTKMGTQGAEDYYMQLPVAYKPKNAPFDVVEELLMVKGVTAPIFEKIKNDLTVFPRQAVGAMKLNVWTVSDQLLKVTMDDLVGKYPDPQKVISLAQEFRDTVQPVKLDSIEQATLLSLNYVMVSDHYRIRSVGEDLASRRTALVEAIVTKNPKGGWTIVHWMEE